MKEKLTMWQERLARNEAAYAKETAKMNDREALYLGERNLRQMVDGDLKRKTPHVRNIAAELIESQVNSNIPQPKVTARKQEDEGKAKLIEDMVRNELDRMPFEEMNDLLERTVPIQGGAGLLVEWDNTERSHQTVGEISVTALHPKQIIPQAGVYSGIEDMDYIILKIPQTKEFIRRRYGVTVENESENEPGIRSAEEETAEDLVTQYIAYYRNDTGGIGLYSWVNDTELEDIEDYQSRRLKRCKSCGRAEAEDGVLSDSSSLGISYPGEEKPVKREKGTCPYCGGKKWESKAEEYEELYAMKIQTDGTIIPAGTKIPFYKPDIYPVLLQKNVSIHGRFLGDSDIDKIRDQQNTTNRLSAKIIDKTMTGGSYMTLPAQADIRADGEDMKLIYLTDPSHKTMIDVFTMQADTARDVAYLNQVYEEARQVIGITDSFQGRKDATATSGKAKEFAAAQSAGRLESKRIMKNAMYAALFEAIFKFRLAYADEPRPVISEDIHGNKEYQDFDRYDFLKQDEAGEWYWNDQFLFSCDTSAPLANNREAMWQETRMNLQTGAFGDPASLTTLILFWSKMEQLHYPGAGETKRFLEEERAQQMQQQMQQQTAIAEQQEVMQRMQAGQIEEDIPPEMIAQIEEQARQDAAGAAAGQF